MRQRSGSTPGGGSGSTASTNPKVSVSGSVRGAVAWPLDRHAAGAQLDLREAAFVAWYPWRDLDGRDDQRGLTGESLKQCRSIGERTVVARPDRQIHLAWTMSQMVPDVPLLVIDHDHLGGLLQSPCRCS